MTQVKEVVKRFNAACESKDVNAMKELLHTNYKLNDPMMKFNSAQELLEGMQDCPFDGTCDVVSMLEDGNKVIQVLDMKMTKPMAYTFRMCDIVTVENGKILSEETFYDTAQIPEEAKKLGQQSLNDNSKKSGQKVA